MAVDVARVLVAGETWLLQSESEARVYTKRIESLRLPVSHLIFTPLSIHFLGFVRDS
jgi:hypothetical protein